PAPDESARALERLEGALPLGLRAEHAHVDLRRPEVLGHVHLGDRLEAEARVLQLSLDEVGDLLPDQLVHPLEPHEVRPYRAQDRSRPRRRTARAGPREDVRRGRRTGRSKSGGLYRTSTRTSMTAPSESDSM